MLELNGTFLVLFLSFAIFAFLMRRFFYDPMKKIRDERDNYVESMLLSAQKAKIEADETVKKYNSKIEEARLQSSSLLEKEILDAKEKREGTLKSEREKTLEEQKQKIEILEQEFSSSKSALNNEVNHIAKMISLKLIKEEIKGKI